MYAKGGAEPIFVLIISVLKHETSMIKKIIKHPK